MADDASDDGGSRRIKGLLRASELIDVIRDNDGATLSEIQAETDLTTATVHTYLQTLREVGFLTKDDGTYNLGLRFVTMGEYVRNRSDLYRAGQKQVDRLANRTGEYAHLVVEGSGREVAVYESRGENAIATEYHLRMRETPQYLHDSAAGKAILAHLPAERREEILANAPLERQTPNTITDRDALREELAAVREQGFAINDEEQIRGMCAVGAPILSGDEAVAGAVSVSGPTSRLKGEQLTVEIPEAVMETANLIEVNLETSQFDAVG